jgi:transposase
MRSCPQCRATETWALGDGRLKCRACGTRFSWRSVWDAVHLAAPTKNALLEAFTQGVTPYRQRFDAGACVDSRERFNRLARACCALDSLVDASVAQFATCACTPQASRSRLRGWSTATRIVLLGIAHERGRVRITAPPLDVAEVLPLLRERTAIGGLCSLGNGQALANLRVQGRYVVVPPGSHTSLAMTPSEWFWEFALERLRAFRKIPCKFLHLYIGEICFRFNQRGLELAAPLRQLLEGTSINDARRVIAPSNTSLIRSNTTARAREGVARSLRS